MSEHEYSLETGYDTPVPELDDHRHQSASVQKPRSRRGTVDTIHSTGGRTPHKPDLASVNRNLLKTREHEEAIIDEEAGGVSPIGHDGIFDRSRRGTVTTLDPRSVSPPNSVKAFADARRREREPSTSEPSKAHAEPYSLEDHGLNRMHSISGASYRSHRSIPSRRYTDQNDAQSFTASVKSEAEEDVCFPPHNTGNKDSLRIDFEALEEFIAEEESREKTPPKGQPQARIFHDLRGSNASSNRTMAVNGDIVDVPSARSSSMDEKLRHSSLESVNRQHSLPTNRFEFFSSQKADTIHAAEFGDLVLPGEDIRSLFALPQGEEEGEGVWWLNMNNPTEEEIRALCRAFGVHPLTIEDIGTQEAREKIELFSSYYFACFRSFTVTETDNGPEYEPFNIYVVVFREGTLSFSFSQNAHAAQVRKRITMLKDYVALSSDWICYALM